VCVCMCAEKTRETLYVTRVSLRSYGLLALPPCYSRMNLCSVHTHTHTRALLVREHSNHRSPSPPARTRDYSRERSSSSREPESERASNNTGQNLYVANLSSRTEEKDLTELFKKFGEVW